MVTISESCIGCEACLESCPVEALSMDGSVAVCSDACVDCGACVGECPVDAISQ